MTSPSTLNALSGNTDDPTLAEIGQSLLQSNIQLKEEVATLQEQQVSLSTHRKLHSNPVSNPPSNPLQAVYEANQEDPYEAQAEAIQEKAVLTERAETAERRLRQAIFAHSEH